MNTSIKLRVLLPALFLGSAFMQHGALQVGAHRGRSCMKTQTDATALRRGDSRSLLLESDRILLDATALPRGVSRLLLLVHKVAVAGAARVNLHGARPWHPKSVPTLFVATNVTVHGARPWHLSAFSQSLGREWAAASGQGKSNTQDPLVVSSEQRA